MSYLSQSKTSKSRRQKKVNPSSAARVHRPNPSSLTYDILSLQHSAGNQATTNLLQQSIHSLLSSEQAVPSIQPATSINGVPPIVLDVLNSPGQPLDPGTASTMEARFGHDLSQVRVHTDEQAAVSAQAVGARAYTVGRDIVFSEGRYAPETGAGQRLLAHELAHVIQQSRGGATSPPLMPGNPLEREAYLAARAVSQGQERVQITGVSGHGMARENGHGAESSDDAQRLEDDKQLQARGITRQQLIDYSTMTRGDFWDKYGLIFWWHFRGKARALPGDLLYRVLPKQDQTLYLQPSGRIATDADERAERVKNLDPGTPLGGVGYTAARALGASHEEAQLPAAIGNLAQAGLPAVNQSENLVPTRGGAAWGKPTAYEPRPGAYKPKPPKLGGYGPQPLSNNSQANAPRVKTGEIKTEHSKEEARTVALTDWAVNLPDTAYVGVATYDAHGNISLDIHLAGGNQDLVWHNENIGHIDPAHLPRSAYQSREFGIEIEPHVTKYIGEYLGLSFQVKSGSATGPDLVPRTPQMRFNLLIRK